MTEMVEGPPAPDILVALYGKTAELVRTECANRQMGHDMLVRDIIWCWYVDLEKARRRNRPLRMPHVRD